MDRIINLKLLSHPLNWVTVILMLVLAGTGGHLILSLFGQEPPDPEAQTSYKPQQSS